MMINMHFWLPIMIHKEGLVMEVCCKSLLSSLKVVKNSSLLFKEKETKLLFCENGRLEKMVILKNEK